MELILQRNLDFKQLQNLFILTFCFLLTLLGMLTSTAPDDFIYIKIPLFLLIAVFILLLLTRKGLVVENKTLYKGVFLFEKLLFTTIIESDFKIITLLKGKLSTNYGYSYDIKEFHNWEPDLNHSVESFTITLLNESYTQRKRVLILTDINHAKRALDFILKNTDLKYEKYSPSDLQQP